MRLIIFDNWADKMQRHAEFYDPHPGFGGAMVPLPKLMYAAAHEMNWQVMAVDKALEKLRQLAEQLNGRVKDSEGFISFEYRSGSFVHGYRLFKERTFSAISPVRLATSVCSSSRNCK